MVPPRAPSVRSFTNIVEGGGRGQEPGNKRGSNITGGGRREGKVAESGRNMKKLATLYKSYKLSFFQTTYENRFKQEISKIIQLIPSSVRSIFANDASLCIYYFIIILSPQRGDLDLTISSY